MHLHPAAEPDPLARVPTADGGQALVEFALVLPIALFLLLIMLEVGLAFSHKLTVGYATREGARTGRRARQWRCRQLLRRGSRRGRQADHRRHPAHPEVARLGREA